MSRDPYPSAAEPAVHAVAIFPWLTCSDPVEIGPVRILPYVRGSAPGELPHATQADLDAVLSAYAVLPNQPVPKAALLEWSNWRTGMDAHSHVVQLFQARDAVVCAALSKRELFRGHFGYCNTHAYTLAVQRYVSGRGDRFVFYTRRRDGSTSHMWAADRFAHLRPSHVSETRCDLDRSLCESLLRLDQESPMCEAVREFNSANTDSDDVPEHVEVVMMKSAFEWLLGIGTRATQFVDALQACLGDVLADMPPAEGPMLPRWRECWPKAKRPLEAWARDFCDVRGAAAHGEKAQARFAWQAKAHLAFASVLFPLVLKKRLAASSMLTLTPADRFLLRDLERFLMVDPLRGDVLRLIESHSHPWSELREEALIETMAAHMQHSIAR